MAWTTADIPDLSGRVALVTGANTGLGYETATALAGAHCRVLLACRDGARADAALARLRSAVPGADAEVVPLDLADLASVRGAAASVSERVDRLDLLINNAGVMAVPRRLTADGFEMQFGVNHLGHFALTALLSERLFATPGSRVVSVSSLAHKVGRIDFDDLNGERRYIRWQRYAMSKVANLLFMDELDRRLRVAQLPVSSLAAHPGGSNTELARDVGVLSRVMMPIAGMLMQSAAMGALPTLRAATDPTASSGDYYGPDGLGEGRGHPRVVKRTTYSRDRDVAVRLWEISQSLTRTRLLDRT
jgi:NAD(P)-dependent dehydrogenase (short-subunit alcohol dehydrogenase family)